MELLNLNVNASSSLQRDARRGCCKPKQVSFEPFCCSFLATLAAHPKKLDVNFLFPEKLKRKLFLVHALAAHPEKLD